MLTSARYGLDMWTVAATHLETIFVDTESVEAAAQLIAARRLVPILQQKAAKCADWLQQRVFPLLGTGNSFFLFSEVLIVKFHEMNSLLTVGR